MHRHRLPLLLALGALLVGAGCRVDATIEARIDGRSGEIAARFALDREAVGVLGGRVDGGASVADLRRAGWVIAPVRRTRDGGAVAQLSKRFEGPDGFAEVMAEFSGPGGPFAGFRLHRSRSIARVAYRVTGEVDLGAEAAGVAHTPGLADRLRRAGVDPQRVEDLLASRAQEGFRLKLVVDLPGRPPATWEVPYGQRRSVAVSSSTTDLARLALLGLALLLAAAAVVVLRVGRGGRTVESSLPPTD